MVKKAKKAKSVVNTVENVSVSVNVALLQAIANGTVNRISHDDALPMLPPQSDPPLIEVNTGDIIEGNAAVRLTQEGYKMISADVNVSANPVTNGYAIISNAVLPAAKRGGRGGAPVQYPFDKLDVGQSFFVPVSPKHVNPLKTLGSTVSSANMRYSEETGEMKTVQRTKRGEKNKAILDEVGNKVKETVTVPVRKQTRKFTIRAVKSGVAYGDWIAESDGALIARVA